MAEPTNFDGPRQAQGLIPASMATASKGMASMVMPNMGQAMYQMYYPVAYTMNRMQQSIVAAEANPYVDRANTLAIEVQGLQDRADARAAVLQKQAAANQAELAKMNAARLKASRSGSGSYDIKLLRLMTDAGKAIKDLNVAQSGLELDRREAGGLKGQADLLASYGEIGGYTSGTKANMDAIAGVLETKTSTNANSKQIQIIAASDKNGGIGAIRASDDPVVRGAAARALTKRIVEDGKMNEKQAAEFSGDLFRVAPGFATTAGEGKLKAEVRRGMTEAQAMIGAGEQDLANTRMVYKEVLRQAANRLGSGGGSGAFAAERARQASEQLDTDEQAALDKYLAALQNDGRADPDGEQVTMSGMPVTLTKEDIVAGKKAYDKAKKNQAFRTEDAAWFNEEYLKIHRDKVERGAQSEEAKVKALGRAGRTPREVQQEASEMFVRSATAARDLEDYIELSAEGVNNSRDATLIGGASHIARREGGQVFDAGASHPDRSRRLGGTSALRKGPLRQALKAYEAEGGQEGKEINDAKMASAIAALRKRYGKDPEKMTTSIQYLMAMQLVNRKAAAGKSTTPTTVDDEIDPATPPVNVPAPPPTAAADPAPAAASPAASSRAAATSAATPVGSVTPDELDNFLANQELQAFLDGTYVRPEGEPTATTFTSPMVGAIGETKVDQYGGTDALGMGRDFSATDIRTGGPLQRFESPSAYGPGPLDNFANIGTAAHNGNQQGAAVKTDEELMQSRFVPRFQNRPSRAAVVADAPSSASVSATADLFVDRLGNTVDAFGNIVDEQTIAAQQRAAERAAAMTARGTRR